jgi:guanylate kinase
MDPKKRLIILSGPSCVGKSPLIEGLKRVYPEITFRMPVFYTGRRPRNIEVDGIDYHFRPEEEIRALPADRFVVVRTRTVWQGIDLDEMAQLLAGPDPVILEGHPVLGTLFLGHPRVQQMAVSAEVITVFISPASEEEIRGIQHRMGFADPKEATTAIMLPKHIARMQQQGTLLTPEVMKDLHIRAAAAYEEIQMGKEYRYHIINHDGEDSNNWRYTPPIGEAGATLKRFVDIIRSQTTPNG